MKLGALIGAVVGAGLVLPVLTIGVVAGALASLISERTETSKLTAAVSCFGPLA